MKNEDSDDSAYLEEEEEAELDEDEEEEEEKEEEEYETEDEIDQTDTGNLKVITDIDEKDGDHRSIKIKNPEHNVTSEIIQREEMTEAIGIRASQIEGGAPCLTDVSGYKNPIDMAKKEFIDRRNPLKLWRTMAIYKNCYIIEEWKVREMTFPVSNRDILDLTAKQVLSVLSMGGRKIKRQKVDKK
jgi:hypothetical protein